MNARRALVLALLSVAGCAARSAAPSTASPSSASGAYAPSSAASREQLRVGASTSGSVGPSNGVYMGAAPALGSISSVPGTPPARVPDLDLHDEDDEREARIAQWEQELERQRAGLAASLAQCRDICAAAGNVCTAASEICRLTGDLTRANARDARCTRARTACLDAARRRDGACPACPAR
jgi:hypothetical protein